LTQINSRDRPGVAMVAIAIGSMFILDEVVQCNADQAFSSLTSVRLPDHGNTHNLVGRDWYSAKEHGWGDEIPTSNSPFRIRHLWPRNNTKRKTITFRMPGCTQRYRF